MVSLSVLGTVWLDSIHASEKSGSWSVTLGSRSERSAQASLSVVTTPWFVLWLLLSVFHCEYSRLKRYRSGDFEKSKEEIMAFYSIAFLIFKIAHKNRHDHCAFGLLTLDVSYTSDQTC